MIRVWVSGDASGVIDRHDRLGSTFVYDRGLTAEAAVSLTMPIQTASWDFSSGVAPIFEMNLPEGALRERLRRAFAKATGSFDDIDLLNIVGRTQIGRLRYTALNDELNEEVPFQSVDDLIASHQGGDLYRHLIDRFASVSGISGVQPKFLIRDTENYNTSAPQHRELSQTFRGATHIVKFWDTTEYPQLAANEFFCLKAAEACGLPVAPYRLSHDGRALVMNRFDLDQGTAYRGFEDMCVLNAKRTDDKYAGSYETNIVRAFQRFGDSPQMRQETLALFKLIVLNCVIRNGDAHLKNFGVLYDQPEGVVHLAPAYDLVTTTVYEPRDEMALTLNGTKRWPTGKDLLRFAAAKSLGSPQEIKAVFQLVADSVQDTRRLIVAHMREFAEFHPVGDRMLEQWDIGLAQTLEGIR